MMTKILLADLAHTHSVADTSLTVPLGLGYIKAYAEARHANQIDIKLFRHPELLLSAAAEIRPDIIGFANYAWNENLNRAVGRYLRQLLPDTLIVAGGPNIDPDPRQQRAFLARHDYLNFIILDGGEEPFAELIEWWCDDRGNLDTLPMNIVRSEGSNVIATPERELTKIIKEIESPYLGGHLDEFLAAGMVPMFESNRGCPFKCTFCAWGSASKDLVRRFDVETTIAEIRYVGSRTRVQNWIFCDANFGILKRDIDLALEIRKIHDETGHPKKCHIWLAKNVTERNLQIGEILGEMTVPVMAIQSLDEDVLRAIKRENISTDTYVEYQRKFHRMGSQTYSDLIVPLPNETLLTHLDGLRQLMKFGVDKIVSHNMRLLAGAETNSPQTRKDYLFRTRYRLIHGDAGAYRCADGTILRCFEYEESLRETATMSEQEVFFLRKLHFTVDFCWNTEVYKPQLQLLLDHGVDPVGMLIELVSFAESNPVALGPSGEAVAEFFAEFDRRSRAEWFDSAEEIEAHFLEAENFSKLLNQQYEKLNILFSLVLLRDYKIAFDQAIEHLSSRCNAVPSELMKQTADLTQAMFQGLESDPEPKTYRVEEAVARLLRACATQDKSDLSNNASYDIHLTPNERRTQFCTMIREAKGRTLSKAMNANGFHLSDLKLDVDIIMAQDDN